MDNWKSAKEPTNKFSHSGVTTGLRPHTAMVLTTVKRHNEHLGMIRRSNRLEPCVKLLQYFLDLVSKLTAQVFKGNALPECETAHVAKGL